MKHPAGDIRRGPGSAYRRLESFRFLVGRDRGALARFLVRRHAAGLTPWRRLRLIRDCLRVTDSLRGYHSLAEILTVADRVLDRAGRRDLTVVECGVGKGAATAKLSLFVAEAGGRLHAFDSFRGMPENAEVQRHPDGRPAVFRRGAFHGRLAEVERNLDRFGAPGAVTLYKGWFEETLPAFDRPIDVALLDVDLAESTRTCLRHLYPRLRPDGVLFTQDGHLSGVVALLGDAGFWRREVGVEPPDIPGLGRRKLLEIPPSPGRNAHPR